MKKNCILCCVIFGLLSAIPENQGYKIIDSLSCYMLYQKHTVCSWSESRNATQFVNMSLALNNGSQICMKIEPVRITPTHLNWTCYLPYSDPNYNWIYLTFIPNKQLESRLNVSTEGDTAKPQNLRCKDAYGQITCSWEVRLAVTDSVDFSLYYINESGGENECKPNCQQENPMYLTCHCNVTFGNNSVPDMLRNISVRPRKSILAFEDCQFVKLQPRTLIMKETKQGEVFVASWTGPNEKTGFKHHYELCYWRENNLKLNEVTSDCPGENKLRAPDHHPEVALYLGRELQPSSNYSVKVRVHLEEENPHHCYRGPWSEWSNVQRLKTKAVPNLIWLYILIPLCVIILIMCALYGCRVLVRYKKLWEDGIPNPNKSSIIEGFRKEMAKQNGSGLLNEEHLYVVPCNKVMWTPQMSEDYTQFKQDKGQISRPDSELFYNDVTPCIFVCNSTNDLSPTDSVTDGYKPFSEMIDEQQSTNTEHSHSEIIAFDGPYLFS
ncbi:cytokine receptor common subunit beta-like isoform X2 [Mixophyes fleayi]